MADVRIKLSKDGARELRRSTGVQQELLRRGRTGAMAAGEGIEAELYIGKNRARVTVRTATMRARHRVAVHPEVLLRAIDACR